MTVILDSDDAQSIFVQVASQTISTIIETIENYDPAGVMQIDIQGDIVTLSVFEDQKYVLNKHNASRQIWIASPISGPYHFSYLQNRWINSDGLLLVDLLEREFSLFLNKIKFYL
jgi:iron donor protein CyaY